jgi:stage III sporulation protein AG
MSENIIISKNRRNKLFLPIIVALIGVSLILIGNIMSKNDISDEEKTKTYDVSNLDANEFAKETERRVEEICSSVSGVGSVHAVVSLGGGYRAIYATDSQASNSSYKNQTVLTGNGSSEKPLLIGYQNPEIVGIGVVCSGGDNAQVKADVVSLVSAAFNISTNKIYVAGR